MRSGDLISYTAEEGVRILGEGKLLISDSFPGNERNKYCLSSKVLLHYYYIAGPIVFTMMPSLCCNGDGFHIVAPSSVFLVVCNFYFRYGLPLVV